MTRAGLHCSPAAHRSLGTAPDGTLRFSWGFDTSDEDIDIAVEALRTVADRGRSPAPLGSVPRDVGWRGLLLRIGARNAVGAR